LNKINSSKLPNIRNKQKKGDAKALLLFSGGLDSILSAKILENQGLSVTALAFTSFFFDSVQAERSARENGIKIRVEDISKKHFGIVKGPSFGRGSGMNPCIDCHLLMLKEAKKIVESEGYDFLATGEVLGQRPMSQNAAALELIEKKAGLEGKILRPLSAKVLPESQQEKTGLVDRKKLFGFSGRGRRKQIELAGKLGVKNFPTPAGGCVLTEKEYSQKLKDLLEKTRTVKKSDIDLLRIGRHFWIYPVRKADLLKSQNITSEDENSIKSTSSNFYNGEGTKVILGRNHEENIELEKLCQKGDALIELKGVPGPLALIRGKDKMRGTELAKEKIRQYARKLKDKNPEFSFPKLSKIS